MSANKRLPHDSIKADPIIEYAQILIGFTLREQVNVDEIDNPRKRKGSFGNAVESYFFGYDINSDSNPDFAEVDMELKTTDFAASHQRIDEH